VHSFEPYTDAIQDWTKQHHIVPDADNEADKKAKELLAHLETHRLDIFQRKYTHTRAGLLLTGTGAKKVGKCRTFGAERVGKRLSRATKTYTSYKDSRATKCGECVWLVGRSTETGRLYFRWQFCERRPRQLLRLGERILEGFRAFR
jgi:hypothetical protein